MGTSIHGRSTAKKPIRVWPGLIAVILQWTVWLIIPAVNPDAMVVGMFGGLIGGLVVLIWWAFFSRAPGVERWAGIGLMIIAVMATRAVLHESIRTLGMGIGFYFYAIPVLSLALVFWAAACRGFSPGKRRLAMVVVFLMTCGGWAALRTRGIAGDGTQDFTWRWSGTPEERLLAKADEVPEAIPDPHAPQVSLEKSPVRWSGFRGPNRSGIVRGAQIQSNWSTSPPQELWRRPIGPGWSSFAVQGSLVFTQEQRGDNELVSCYHLNTGAPVWRHADPVRFWESHAGAGPRATPTLSNGRLFAFGATGILNALNAIDGTVLWSRNAAADTTAEMPHWGFTSSPLAVDELVVVDTGTLVAYDAETGEPKWFGPKSTVNYSSPHFVTIDSVPQILFLDGSGAISVAPIDGRLLWEHPWSGSSIVQPAITPQGDVLISALSGSRGIGMRRLKVAQGPQGWKTEELWTSVRLKPYFNDFVVHRGHVYGFDGRFLACIDSENGAAKWKGGRYGYGQLVLLAEHDLLLIISERGDLALVEATPDRFKELGRIKALQGKTWNHPVVVDNILLARNAQEMAAFNLVSN